MAKRQFHNLAGLVRDLATARGEGAELWRQFVDELEYVLDEIEGPAVDEDDGLESDHADEHGLGDESSDYREGDVGDDGPDEGRGQLGLGLTRSGSQPLQRLAAQVGTPSQALGGASVPDAAPVGRAGNGVMRVTRMQRGRS